MGLGAGSMAAAGICLGITALVPDSQRVLIVVFLTLGFGLMDLMMPPAWAICLDVGQSYAGTVSGAMNTAWSVGGFMCATLFGFLVKKYGDYNLPLMIMAGILFVSAFLFTRIDPTTPLVPDQE